MSTENADLQPIVDAIEENLCSLPLEFQLQIKESLAKNLCDHEAHAFHYGYMDINGKLSSTEMEGYSQVRKCYDCSGAEYHLPDENRWVTKTEFLSSNYITQKIIESQLGVTEGSPKLVGKEDPLKKEEKSDDDTFLH